MIDDTRLTFNKHMEELKAKAKRRMGAILATTGKNWGGKTATTSIRTAYIARGRA